MSNLGGPADPRGEQDAIRRRLEELAPPGPVGLGALAAGAVPVAGAGVALLVTLAISVTVDATGARVAVLVVGLALSVVAAARGVAGLRRWLRGTSMRRGEQQALLVRLQQLTSESGRVASPPPPAPRAWPGPNERFRMVVGGILASVILVSVAATVLLRAR